MSLTQFSLALSGKLVFSSVLSHLVTTVATSEQWMRYFISLGSHVPFCFERRGSPRKLRPWCHSSCIVHVVCQPGLKGAPLFECHGKLHGKAVPPRMTSVITPVKHLPSLFVTFCWPSSQVWFCIWGGSCALTVHGPVYGGSGGEGACEWNGGNSPAI